MADSSPAPASSVKRRWYHPRALARRLVVYALTGYVIVGMYLFLMQNRMIYEGAITAIPKDAAVREARDAGLVPWEQTTPGASAPQGFVPPDFTNPAPRGTIVFFHGNGEAAWEWAEQIRRLHPARFSRLPLRISGLWRETGSSRAKKPLCPMPGR